MTSTPATPRASDLPSLSAITGVDRSAHQSTPTFSGLGGVGFRRPTRAEPTPAAPQARISETFRPSTCPKCSSITLAGIAEGLTIHLDPTPLNAQTEAATLVAGGSTWHMTSDREVCWRSAHKVSYYPAGNHRHYATFARHQCDAPVPATITDWAWAQRAAIPTTEEPQF